MPPGARAAICSRCTRALRALELIAEAGELGVTELGRAARRPQGDRLPARRHARGTGPVERDPVTEKYRLGFGLIRLAGAAMAGLDLVRTAQPHPGGPRRAHARDREPRRPLGRRRRLRRPGRGHALDRQRQLGRAQHAAALHVERQGAAGVHAATTSATACSRARSNVRRRRTIVDVCGAPVASSATGPRPRVRADDRGARRGPERGRRAGPRRRRSGGRRPVRVRTRVPDARRSTCRGSARLTMEAAGAVSRRLGYVERGRTAAG